MKIVFSDIDHTLMYELTVADETIRLIEEIRAKAPFVLITARSLASVHQHVPEIPHDSLIVENGCVVYEGNEIDQAWDARIKPFLAVVEGYKEDLGLIIRPKTRMLSISMAQNNLTWNDADAIKDALPEELVMRTSSNETGDFLEMYPA
ncbi:MAG TPA: HAD hydrolase family protein, partial [Armatimonadota bacterium]|nr:HAD hydrolase family protein [Armatimonadota bacterium]